MKNTLLAITISTFCLTACLVDAPDPTATAQIELVAGSAEWVVGAPVVTDTPYFIQVGAADSTCRLALDAADTAMRATRMAFTRACGAARGTLALATELYVLPGGSCFSASAPPARRGGAVIPLQATFRRVGLVCRSFDSGDVPHAIDRCGDRIADTEVMSYTGPVSSPAAGPITLALTQVEATAAANNYLTLVRQRAESECGKLRGRMTWDAATGVAPNAATRLVESIASGRCDCP